MHPVCLALDGKVERCRWTFETIGGFNQKWRLEVPQVQAAAAGSVLVLKATKEIGHKKLEEIEHNGLGERRVEGFGRVLFLKHCENNKTICLDRTVDKPAIQKDSAELSSPDKDQIRFLEERIVLAAAQAELDQVAVEIANVKGKIPTNSLMGRVRTLFRAVNNDDSAMAALKNLRVWCDDPKKNLLALKEKASGKLEDCKLKKGTLMEWLRGLSKCWDISPVERWEKLVEKTKMVSTKLAGLAECHHLNSQATAQKALEQNAALLVVYLIDAVLAALAKQNRRDG